MSINASIEETLEKMGIYELRALGREVGISSPTVLKRDELISQIQAIQNGELKPQPKSRRGRPAKEFINIDENDLMSMKTEKDSFVEDKEKDAEKNNRKANFNEDNGGYGKNVEFSNDLQNKLNDSVEASGVLEIYQDGYGFLRMQNYDNSDKDAYISQNQIKRFNLKTGDFVTCRVSKDKDRCAVLRVLKVNDKDPDSFRRRNNFDNLTPIFPNERLVLETDKSFNLDTRIIDLLCPIGKGQRALIVSPPKAGKTTLLKNIAKSIVENNKNVHLMVLLIDERPEEVTDMQMDIDGEIIYSTFDEVPEKHIRHAEMVLERAKRLVEDGKDVVILLDSLTRLARASNLITPSSGRTLSGGLDPSAFYFPKRFYGSARNIADGGSLTIIATALVDTGSKMDDVIYEEFKGTGNMELHLDRNLSEKRIYPAINVLSSGTRKEEKLLNEKELECSYKLRRYLGSFDTINSTLKLIQMLEKTNSNEQFVKAFLNKV